MKKFTTIMLSLITISIPRLMHCMNTNISMQSEQSAKEQKGQACETATYNYEINTQQKELQELEDTIKIIEMITANCSDFTIAALKKLIYEYANDELHENEWNRLQELYKKIDMTGTNTPDQEKLEFITLLQRAKRYKNTYAEPELQILEASEATAGLIS